jgi:two-component system phosphate regulon sensor histidine kinase PhoR
MGLSRLFWRVFLGYGLLYVTLSVCFVVLDARRHEQLLTENTRRWLGRVAALLTDELQATAGDWAACQRRLRVLQLQTGLRYTVIGDDGTVWAESYNDPATMENHGSRPEVRAARQSGLGQAVRRSATDGREYHYVARFVRDPEVGSYFVRVAIDMTSMRREIRDTRLYLWLTAVVAGIIAAPLSYFMVRQIVKPLTQLTELASAIAAGDFHRRVEVQSRDELGRLGIAFGRMQEELARRIQELQQYAERLAAVLGGMVEGVLAVDPQQRVILANDACKSLLGIADRDVVGRPLLEIVRNREIAGLVTESFSSGALCDREVTMSGPPRRVLRVLATRLRDEPCSGAVVVLHDVTELRRLENIRRDFVANVSHELKTPLASIKAYTETLLAGAIRDADHNVRFVERIDEQSQRLHRLIVDLLHLSRVESGKEAFDFTSVSLSEAVHRCLTQYGEIADQSGVSLLSDTSEPDVKVWADRQGVDTILDNLVDNAIKYTLPGGRVLLRWRCEGMMALLEVEDSGIGIASEDQQRIFERFYRVDKARSRELGGTGLGLAIVKHLAQAFGGEARVSSELGRGSTFQVRLRRAPETGGTPPAKPAN